MTHSPRPMSPRRPGSTRAWDISATAHGGGPMSCRRVLLRVASSSIDVATSIARSPSPISAKPRASSANIQPQPSTPRSRASARRAAAVHSRPFAGEKPGEFVAPHGLVIDSRGDLYVAEVAWTAKGRNETPPREIR